MASFLPFCSYGYFFMDGELRFFTQTMHFQVGCRLMQILMETAYIQAPMNESEDGVPDIRPAFVHSVKTLETP